MIVLLSALIVSAAMIWAGLHIATAVDRSAADRLRNRTLEILGIFAPAVSAAAGDPRAILAWQPLARTARDIFREEFALIDAAAGGSFPFSTERVQAAHAQWTSDWLAWERVHDAEYKLKAAVAEEEIAAAGPSGVLRARLDAVESEKLDLYQRRYGEYVRVAKALQALLSTPQAHRS
jgi:hypothetical protein